MDSREDGLSVSASLEDETISSESEPVESGDDDLCVIVYSNGTANWGMGESGESDLFSLNSGIDSGDDALGSIADSSDMGLYSGRD
ncbi:hypothetical protein CesoFtcFv8_027248 [Champsocephalus esox]|uniref:Uncharacterized protein n=2 Tax=Champsocephalus TaxID=52236 RepID=A0AAN8GX99_CHAGU|nr:hypothetical protein CesoFtcFv8_027248 [Champsocephalus esox]KAK5893932.1 hypothetical protein CgunFtcFv8_006756 [Champsocephalus gunnari]